MESKRRCGISGRATDR